MKPSQAILGAFIALAVNVAAAQSSFTVTPLRVEIGSSAAATTVDVINTSSTPLTVQVQQKAWLQRTGQDEQDDTRDLILSPAIFTVKGGEKQIVRIALRGAPDTERERAYRLVVSELPTPQINVTPNAIGFRVALRMDLPMFVAAVKPAAPAPSYHFDAASGTLTVRNTGTAHVRYTDGAVLQAGRKVADLPTFTVLANGERTFALPKEKISSGGNLRIQADSNAGPIDSAVPDAR